MLLPEQDVHLNAVRDLKSVQAERPTLVFPYRDLKRLSLPSRFTAHPDGQLDFSSSPVRDYSASLPQSV